MHNTRSRGAPQGLAAVALVASLLSWAHSGSGQQVGGTPDAAVHAVFFYSPTCPHCERVIREHLVPMQERYGESLVLLALSTATEYGSSLFRAAMERYEVPAGEWGVPFLIVGGQHLMGGLEIPQRFPVLLDAGLASGGIDLPDFPELISFLDAQGALRVLEPGPRYVFQDPNAPSSTSQAPPDTAGGTDTAEADEVAVTDIAPRSPVKEPSADPAGALPEAASGPEPVDTTGAAAVASSLDLDAASSSAERTPLERFSQDRTANTLALAVLAAMILAVLRSVDPRREVRRASWPEWTTPALCILGLGVAVYLSFVEITGNPVTCGPVGDCNTVQQSPYATLFGLVPVGVLGTTGYLTILALWLGRYLGTGPLHRFAAIGLWGTALAGTLFSVYLTYLEPFVIGATCMWCLTSAVVMTLLLLSSLAPASAAFRRDPAGIRGTA